MDKSNSKKFEKYIGTKYHLYNSLFLRLPFDLIHQTGILLPLLTKSCNDGYSNGGDPRQIIENFFTEFIPEATEKERITLLFNFIKYIERQVVLFDAAEEAAFHQLHLPDGPGTITDMMAQAKSTSLTEKLKQKLADFRLRIVLTAHPTQFYPGPVLGIITDLSNAIKEDLIYKVNDLLLQLGKTPFINRTKPTPLDEAKSLIWYLRKVFYHAIPEIVTKIETQIDQPLIQKDIISIGFWPGGDRDGNPNVTSETTLAVAAHLRYAILSSYEKDIQKLRRRLTFKNVYDQITAVGSKMHKTLLNSPEGYGNAQSLSDDLMSIHRVLVEEHDNLFGGDLELLMNKVEIFGFHFACLDIRQDSRKHEALIEEIIQVKAGIETLNKYRHADIVERMDILAAFDWTIDASVTSDPISQDIINSIKAIEEIQAANGIQACHRYVISNSRHALDVYTILVLAKWIHPKGTLKLDIVPLFESVDDLSHAAMIMEQLYEFLPYREHLNTRQYIQTVMLGFSDGTKDGGYVKANWSIFKAKEELTKSARANGIKVIFFDGRGGPPARGGGNTHKFYSSLGSNIENNEVQLTIQGQTISSKFGNKDHAIFNLEQLLTAGIENDLYPQRTPDWTIAQRTLMDELADLAYHHYAALKNHPDFLPYMLENGTVSFYGESNIGSRPDKRGSGALTLESLRAIPFVGTWSQLKQNVPGYYGFGTALEELYNKGRKQEISELYEGSKFFQTLAGNSMQSLAKCYFPLTKYLEHHPKFGDIWKKIFTEFERSNDYLTGITNADQLIADNISLKSIRVREQIVLPLLTIQQYALLKLKENSGDNEAATLYRSLITRTMPGIINAARNSA